jgi:hypothetical protein
MCNCYDCLYDYDYYYYNIDSSTYDNVKESRIKHFRGVSTASGRTIRMRNFSASKFIPNYIYSKPRKYVNITNKMNERRHIDYDDCTPEQITNNANIRRNLTYTDVTPLQFHWRVRCDCPRCNDTTRNVKKRRAILEDIKYGN